MNRLMIVADSSLREGRSYKSATQSQIAVAYQQRLANTCATVMQKCNISIRSADGFSQKLTWRNMYG